MKVVACNVKRKNVDDIENTTGLIVGLEHDAVFYAKVYFV